MTPSDLINAVVPGLSLEEALRTFVAACNQPDTLYINERWFAPRRQQLLSLLSDPITEDEAFVLREILRRRLPFEVVFDWLTEKPVPWNEYLRVKTEMREYHVQRMIIEGTLPCPDAEAPRRRGCHVGRPEGDAEAAP